MQVVTAASRLTKTFSSRAAIIEFIKFASKGAIPRAIHFVFRERALAVAGGLWARSFSRREPRHGMVVCRSAWTAGAEACRRASCAAANRVGTRAVDWDNYRAGSCGPNQPA